MRSTHTRILFRPSALLPCLPAPIFSPVAAVAPPPVPLTPRPPIWTMCASLTRSLKPRPEPFILPPEVHAPASHRVAAKARVGSVDNILPKGEACAACKSRKVRCGTCSSPIRPGVPRADPCTTPLADAVRPACGACQRTAKFKLRDPNAVVCKYPKRKEPRRLAVKTEDTSESALPRERRAGCGRALSDVLTSEAQTTSSTSTSPS